MILPLCIFHDCSWHSVSTESLWSIDIWFCWLVFQCKHSWLYTSSEWSGSAECMTHISLSYHHSRTEVQFPSLSVLWSESTFGIHTSHWHWWISFHTIPWFQRVSPTVSDKSRLNHCPLSWSLFWFSPLSLYCFWILFSSDTAV